MQMYLSPYSGCPILSADPGSEIYSHGMNCIQIGEANSMLSFHVVARFQVEMRRNCCCYAEH